MYGKKGVGGKAVDRMPKAYKLAWVLSILLLTTAGLWETGQSGYNVMAEIYGVGEAVYDTGIPGVGSLLELDLIPPSPPEIPAVTDTRRGGTVVVEWSGPEDADLAGYYIYRTGSASERKRVNEEPLTENHFRDTGLVDGEEYIYEVTALDFSGNESEPAGSVSVIPTHDTIPPPVPGGLVVQDPGTGGEVIVSWSPVEAGDLAGYHLYRRDRGEWRKLNTQPLTETVFIDTAISNGTVYRYQVTSIDDIDNESGFGGPVIGWGSNRNATVIWQFGRTGREGVSPSRLYGPYGIAVSETGTYLVADTQNSRVLELDGNGDVIWTYDSGLIEPVRVKQAGHGRILIVDAEGSRVLLVDKETAGEVWAYGMGKRKHGRYDGRLNNPHDAEMLPNGNIIIADTGNGRLVEVNNKGKAVWSSDDSSFKYKFNLPVSVQAVEDGHFLVTDAGAARVVESDRKGRVKWSFGTGEAGERDDQLDFPSYSLRLGNGNTLIIDSMNYRILEVSEEGFLVWTFGGRGKGSSDENSQLYEPGGVAWLPDNHILVADQHNHRAVKIDH